MPTPVDRPEPGELVKTVAELVDAVNAGSGGLVLPIQTDGTTTLFQLRTQLFPHVRWMFRPIPIMQTITFYGR